VGLITGAAKEVLAKQPQHQPNKWLCILGVYASTTAVVFSHQNKNLDIIARFAEVRGAAC
jgi:hypothetical protein